jgi:hypothetical protein
MPSQAESADRHRNVTNKKWYQNKYWLAAIILLAAVVCIVLVICLNYAGRSETRANPTPETFPQPEVKHATAAENRWVDHRKFLAMSGIVASHVKEHQILETEFNTHRGTYIKTLTGTQDTVKLMEENMFAFSQFNDARAQTTGKLSAVDNILGHSTELYAFDNHPKMQGGKNRDHIYGFSRDHSPGQPVVKGTYKTTFGIRDRDSAVTAHDLVTEGKGKRPAILNMANQEEPGGGALCGARAQEECLFRSSVTTWAQHMPLTVGGTRGSLTGRYYSITRGQIQLKASGGKPLNLGPLLNTKMDTIKGVWEYPLDGHGEEFNGCILARNSVHVREYRGKTYITLPNVRVYDYITKAVPHYGAPRDFPSSLDEKKLDNYYREFLADWNGPNSKTVQRDFPNRLRAIAWVGWKGGYDMLVLGPTGCGAFSCDPRKVAEAFYQVFVLEFPGVFKHIELAYLTFSPKDKFGFGEFQTRFINRANKA